MLCNAVNEYWRLRITILRPSGVLANERLALAVGTLGVLLREGRDRAHLAVFPLAAQPAEEGAFELFGVEAVGLGAPVLPRHRHARGMNDWASIPRALSQRASQKPSRPASKATAIRSTLCPAFSASARHRSSSFKSSFSSAASFFNGWRSTPGIIPATSQLLLLSSKRAT